LIILLITVIYKQKEINAGGDVRKTHNSAVIFPPHSRTHEVHAVIQKDLR